MRRALFVVDDRPEAGLGHVVRCGALRAELERRGWECETESADASLRDDVFGGVVIVDMQSPNTPRIARALPRCRGYALICDAPREALPGLLVCGSAGVTPEMLKCCGPNRAYKRVLAGPQYSLLRERFRTSHIRAEADGINMPLRPPGILDLRAVSGLSADELSGALFTAWACRDVVITYGGMRAMEAACVGAPMVVVPRNEGEWLNAAGLVQAGAAMTVEYQDEAERAACALLGSPPMLRAMSEAGRKLVDGQGCRRVADAIEEAVA